MQTALWVSIVIALLPLALAARLMVHACSGCERPASPRCRSCRHDVRTRDDERPTRCTECGANLSIRGSVLFTRPQWRWPWVVLSLICAAGALVTFQYVDRDAVATFAGIEQPPDDQEISDAVQLADETRSAGASVVNFLTSTGSDRQDRQELNRFLRNLAAADFEPAHVLHLYSSFLFQRVLQDGKSRLTTIFNQDMPAVLLDDSVAQDSFTRLVDIRAFRFPRRLEIGYTHPPEDQNRRNPRPTAAGALRLILDRYAIPETLPAFDIDIEFGLIPGAGFVHARTLGRPDARIPAMGS